MTVAPVPGNGLPVFQARRTAQVVIKLQLNCYDKGTQRAHGVAGREGRLSEVLLFPAAHAQHLTHQGSTPITDLAKQPIAIRKQSEKPTVPVPRTTTFFDLMRRRDFITAFRQRCRDWSPAGLDIWQISADIFRRPLRG